MATVSDVHNKISEIASAVSGLKTPFDILFTFTDAHSVIIGAAQLDSALEAALLTKMCQLSRDMKDDIFDGHGPLNNFAAKILMAYALGLISRDFYNSLVRINKLRVKFAHSKTFLSFQDPAPHAVASQKAELQRYQARFSYAATPGPYSGRIPRPIARKVSSI